MPLIPVNKVDKILLNKKYYALFCILKGIRNGAVYGAKVRFPHALINSLLFRSCSLQQHAKTVYQATSSHSTSLALFVGFYKSLEHIFQKFLSRSGFNHFLAASAAGFLIFGRDHKIHEQINLYLLSRVTYALIKLASHKEIIPSLDRPIAFRLFSALVWGVGVWLFHVHPTFLQNSLASSMTYLYNDSNHWSGFLDFVFGSG